RVSSALGPSAVYGEDTCCFPLWILCVPVWAVSPAECVPEYGWESVYLSHDTDTLKLWPDVSDTSFPTDSDTKDLGIRVFH
ncbi:hypothetical protein KIPB_011048, partial [Kipferlia bialata]